MKRRNDLRVVGEVVGVIWRRVGLDDDGGDND